MTLDLGTVPAREGSMVRLRCKFEARPNPHSFGWYHDVSRVLLNVCTFDNVLLCYLILHTSKYHTTLVISTSVRFGIGTCHKGMSSDQ